MSQTGPYRIATVMYPSTASMSTKPTTNLIPGKLGTFDVRPTSNRGIDGGIDGRIDSGATNSDTITQLYGSADRPQSCSSKTPIPMEFPGVVTDVHTCVQSAAAEAQSEFAGNSPRPAEEAKDGDALLLLSPRSNSEANLTSIREETRCAGWFRPPIICPTPPAYSEKERLLRPRQAGESHSPAISAAIFRSGLLERRGRLQAPAWQRRRRNRGNHNVPLLGSPRLLLHAIPF